MRGRNWAAAAALLAATAAGCSASSSSTAPRPNPAPPEVQAAGPTDWPLPGHDYTNSRQAGTSPVKASTVAGLTQAWQVDTPGALTTAAIVLKGTVYAQDDMGVVVAVDATTGAVRWKSAPTGFTVGPEGVAVGWGKVFAATTNGVEALDLTTGKVLWTKRLTTTGTAGVDMQPTVADGKVLISTVPVTPGLQFNGGDDGVLYALDASTGRTDWSFDTVDSTNDWGNPTVNSGGGVWYPPSVDVATGTVYIGTANPGPFPGTAQYPNGSSRPGDNLYTDSTVALSLATGKLLWYHQAVAHDLFDQDFVHTLVVPLTGPSSSVVVGAGKGGQVIGMDPATGKVRWSLEVGQHLNHDLTSLPAGTTEVLPGTFGGVLTPPASAGGTVYLALLNAPTMLHPDQTSYFGGKLGTADGEVVAIDAATGKIAWDTEVTGDPTGGVTVVNDLVLTGTFQGNVVALDRTTGAVVWTHAAPAGVSGWMAVSGGSLFVPTGILGSGDHLVDLHLPGS